MDKRKIIYGTIALGLFALTKFVGPYMLVNYERERSGLERICISKELLRDNSPIIEETENYIKRLYSNGRTYAIVTYSKKY